MPQPEQILEDQLIAQLQDLKYQRVVLENEAALLENLKIQLEKHNKTKLSESEFEQVLNKLQKGNIFEKAQILRDRVDYIKDDGTTGYLELMNQLHWCRNQYQVSNQISMSGTYDNRYDVTILINGLPLVQIELKRRGLELKEAFNQTLRYQRHTYSAGKGLFQYLQLFVISNGVNTKYYANNHVSKQNFKQTFFWADQENKKISQLSSFADAFLEPCHLSRIITRYIVLHHSDRLLMVLRPYQFYATEAIVERVKHTNKFGYIWHTTGSGKTLTSFKASQILSSLPEVHKVLFVVDRKDLDYQTIKEFNHFSAGSIDGTDNTQTLVDQLQDDTPLIVTTLQKLNSAIQNKRYHLILQKLREKKMVFIFDECHRSQFGETHQRIKDYFPKSQLFGFTGTPIFAQNAQINQLGKRTTKELFDQCLHKYVITDAIRDGNVLKFSIEYIRTFKKKDHIIDLQIDDIDRAEVMDDPQRLEGIVDYIITNHNRKTHNKRFTAIFCVSSIPNLIAYYKLFQQKKELGEHQLTVATIFSYGANNADAEENAYFEGGDLHLAAEQGGDLYTTKHHREHLDSFITDYNQIFQTNYSTNNFYSYYKDIGKRVKSKQVDILLVVNMFLTGFDSKLLNTIYVDKNLRYHGLIQAYSRTNRILNELKSQGNVVNFRNLKEATDEAISLFSNKEAIEEIILEPYEVYVEEFVKALLKLKEIAPMVDSVDKLESEEEELAFVQAFRQLMRLRNTMGTFTEFSFEDLPINVQEFEDYKSKYLDIRDKVKSNHAPEKVSILDDIDFEVELIHRDEINVAYILSLLKNLQDVPPKDRKKKEKEISDLLSSEVELRSKKELIERFIQENLPLIRESDDLSEQFENFWTAEREKAVEQLAIDENLNKERLDKLINGFIFTEKTPVRNDIIKTMKTTPTLRERKSKAERVLERITDYVETFINGLG